MSDTNDLGIVLEDKYRLDCVLGRGGMGVVYQATQLPIGRSVAIKTIHRRLAGDGRLVERLRQEARLAGSLGHHNICEVQDVGITGDGRPYLVMPLLQGHTLATEIQSVGRLSAPRTLDIVGQLLEALDAAHAMQIVHRDIKPDNIFLTTEGERPDFVKLLDFGISKCIDQDNSLTTTGQMPGTPAYMSPELVDGCREIDGRSDLFSVGVIFYEMLLGCRPFQGASYFEITNHIREASFPLPRVIDGTIPRPLEKFILFAMARDREDRFPTASKMRAALLPLAEVARNWVSQPLNVETAPAASHSTSATVTDIGSGPGKRRRGRSDK